MIFNSISEGLAFTFLFILFGTLLRLDPRAMGLTFILLAIIYVIKGFYEHYKIKKGIRR